MNSSSRFKGDSSMCDWQRSPRQHLLSTMRSMSSYLLTRHEKRKSIIGHSTQTPFWKKSSRKFNWKWCLELFPFFKLLYCCSSKLNSIEYLLTLYYFIRLLLTRRICIEWQRAFINLENLIRKEVRLLHAEVEKKTERMREKNREFNNCRVALMEVWLTRFYHILCSYLSIICK